MKDNDAKILEEVYGQINEETGYTIIDQLDQLEELIAQNKATPEQLSDRLRNTKEEIFEIVEKLKEGFEYLKPVQREFFYAWTRKIMD